jgi:hypothetical protein
MNEESYNNEQLSNASLEDRHKTFVQQVNFNRHNNRRPRKDKNRLPPFVPLTWDMLNHKAYIELPPSAAKALPYFLGKVKVKNGDLQKYSNEFQFSYREAQKLGFALATFSKIIGNLIKHGFIDPVSKGGLRGKGKSCNIFKLSERWRSYDKSDFEQVQWKCFFQNKDKVRFKM